MNANRCAAVRRHIGNHDVSVRHPCRSEGGDVVSAQEFGEDEVLACGSDEARLRKHSPISSRRYEFTVEPGAIVEAHVLPAAAILCRHVDMDRYRWTRRTGVCVTEMTTIISNPIASEAIMPFMNTETATIGCWLPRKSISMVGG